MSSSDETLSFELIPWYQRGIVLFAGLVLLAFTAVLACFMVLSLIRKDFGPAVMVTAMAAFSGLVTYILFSLAKSPKARIEIQGDRIRVVNAEKGANVDHSFAEITSLRGTRDYRGASSFVVFFGASDVGIDFNDNASNVGLLVAEIEKRSGKQFV